MIFLTTYGKGQTDPPMTLYCMKESGGPQDLTGLTQSNLAMLITVGGVTIVGKGSFQITQFFPGLVQYTPDPTDFATAGSATIVVKITNGSKVNPSLPYSVTVE